LISREYAADRSAYVSCGSVFMGANTYIGNGPNFMVKAIAEENGVKWLRLGHAVAETVLGVPIAAYSRDGARTR